MKLLIKLLPVIEYFAGSILLYYLLILLFGFREVFYVPLLTSGYQKVYPMGFILLLGFAFTLVIMLSKLCLIKINVKFMRYLIFYILWLCVSCFICACYWLYLDGSSEFSYMEIHGYNLNSTYWDYTLKHITKNLDLVKYGLVIAFFSIPYNILLFLLSFIILKYHKVLECKNQKL